jgi:hypothetical protein
VEAVGQARQRIMVGEVMDALFGRLARRSIGETADVVADVPGFAEDAASIFTGGVFRRITSPFVPPS